MFHHMQHSTQANFWRIYLHKVLSEVLVTLQGDNRLIVGIIMLV